MGFSFHEFVVDDKGCRLLREGQEVRLERRAFDLLQYLIAHRDRVVSQSELSQHIYSQDLDRDSNTVEVFIARLRRKLGASYIETVRGLGYRIGGGR